MHPHWHRMIQAKKRKKTAEPDVLPESKVFQMYLEEISSLPVYSEKKQEEMYQKLLAGDESVINPISDSWMIKGVRDRQKACSDLRRL